MIASRRSKTRFTQPPTPRNRLHAGAARVSASARNCRAGCACISGRAPRLPPHHRARIPTGAARASAKLLVGNARCSTITRGGLMDSTRANALNAMFNSSRRKRRENDRGRFSAMRVLRIFEPPFQASPTPPARSCAAILSMDRRSLSTRRESRLRAAIPDLVRESGIERRSACAGS